MGVLQLSHKDSIDFTDYTVIIPSICVGNAAQLSCDLLISSKSLRRIGSIGHPALIPIFGPSAFQHEIALASACELYENKEDKLLVVQFRTPFVYRHAHKLHEFLAKTLKNARRVCVLSGSFGFEKRIIEDSPYEYCASDNFKKTHADQLKKMAWKEFAGQVIYGGGNGLQLYKAFEKENVPVMLLFRYLLEGDNIMDATMIVRELNDLYQVFLQMSEKSELKLTLPISWRLLFGNEAPALIFD